MSFREAHNQRTRQTRSLREEAHGATYALRSMENHEKKKINDVETKTLIQEAHTTIGRTMLLREEVHITDYVSYE